MDHLGGADATFLYTETAETPMHVGSLNVYELPKGYKGDFVAAVRSHIGQRRRRRDDGVQRGPQGDRRPVQGVTPER